MKTLALLIVAFALAFWDAVILGRNTDPDDES